MEVDGSVLEGGGQILRMSIAFSALMGVPVCIRNIRIGRSKPGLAAQHLTGVNLAAKMCNAKVEGAQLGSKVIKFIPGKIKGGFYEADVKTAGSISLLIQIALPLALLSDRQVKLSLKGGTNAEMAPQIDYMTEVFRPQLERFGCSFDLDLHKRGYFPKGGGHVTVNVNPVQQIQNAILVDFGEVKRIFGWSFVAGNVPFRLSEQASAGAKRALKTLQKDIIIECYKESHDVAPHNCNGIVLVCETTTGCILGGSCIGSKMVSPAEVGMMAAQELKTAVDCGSCLDEHAQDQVIIYMALASGKSSFKLGELTMHTKTAIYIAEMFTKVSV